MIIYLLIGFFFNIYHEWFSCHALDIDVTINGYKMNPFLSGFVHTSLMILCWPIFITLLILFILFDDRAN